MKVLDPNYELNIGYIKLACHEDLDNVIDSMKARYTGYSEISNERKMTNDKLATMQSVFRTISQLVFVLTTVIISFTTLLIMKITIYSEAKELGIFKALGFSSARIRLQLALRFAMVTLVGGFVGVIVEVLVGSELFTLALKSLGISSFKLEFSLANALIPFVTITTLAILSAYASSAHTKRVSAYSLIND